MAALAGNTPVPRAAGTMSPPETRSERTAPTARTGSQPVPAAAVEPDCDEKTVADNAEPAPSSETAREEGLPSNTNPDDTNVWPDENAEAAFIAETRGRGEAPATPAPSVKDDEEPAPKALPPLSELVERIPAETRELMDELFRAKFVAVRKVKKSALKPEA